MASGHAVSCNIYRFEAVCIDYQDLVGLDRRDLPVKGRKRMGLTSYRLSFSSRCTRYGQRRALSLYQMTSAFRAALRLFSARFPDHLPAESEGPSLSPYEASAHATSDSPKIWFHCAADLADYREPFSYFISLLQSFRPTHPICSSLLRSQPRST